ncbi:hypothetical protein F7D01_14690 [Erythrobacter sp. 3-20A1M]|uniref:hypothetical protein n=1 Tax=Erythrobacter sp. 3-20A1M TaxID=2653850 RepID=UPI001BFCC0ED|nr:hypothetical protein [Erythrobacter sp. 3-20A1M]QWC58147.1 hypothetical protein F7D01_14690 [Erythrobacter sp. 3-20A1M]
MTSDRDKRAFLIAIPVASILAAFSFAMFGMLGRDQFVTQSEIIELAAIVGAYSVVMLPFVAFGGVLVGLPIAMLLRSCGIKHVAFWSLVGMVTGGGVSLAILGSFAITLTPDVATWAFSIGVIPGFAAALIWWRTTERFDAVGRSYA